MIKVQILTRCEHCEGQAYLPDCEDISATGEKYTRYRPCFHCNGSGKQTKWISLGEFADLLDCATALKPDWAELARKEPISQYQDSRESAGTKKPLAEQSRSATIIGQMWEICAST